MSDILDALRAFVRTEVAQAIAAQKTEPPPALVSVAQFAKQRSISQSTVRAAIRDGALAIERIGGSVRIPANAEIKKRARGQNNNTNNAICKAEKLLGLNRQR